LLGGQSGIEEFQLRRLGAFLQLAGGGQTAVGVAGEQLVAGQGAVDQAPQTVVQAQGSAFAGDVQLALLQGVEQFQARRVGLRGPGFQEPGLLAGVAGDEVFGIPGLGRPWQ